ncbi:MAG: hypothetical protein JSR67_05520 [Proteobacteria bacterium]|nr:hypothetical protein [Pseudomonadota bacterium]
MKTPAFALALLLAGTAWAQNPPTAAPNTQMEARKAEHMQDLATLLDLSDSQKAQVQSILEAQHAKMKTEMQQARAQAKAAGNQPDREQMKAQFQQHQQETLQRLGAVLSAQQLAKFRILQKMRHGHHDHAGHWRHPPPPTDG